MAATPLGGSAARGSTRGRRIGAAAVVVSCLVGLAGVTTAAAGTHGSAATPPQVAAPDAAAARVIAAARKHLGDPYVYGAAGPKAYDCSGLTSSMWRTAGGVSAIPRTAHQQQAWTTPVPAAKALPGDLVFFGTPATHVGIYLGAGWLLDASSSRHQVVERPLWTTAVTYGRVPRATAPAVTGGSGARPVPTPTPAPTPTPTHAPATQPARGSALQQQLVARVSKVVGAAYSTAGTGPTYGDAGLIVAAWRASGGRTLPNSRAQLAALGATVNPKALRPGDIVVYGTGENVWHVGVYVGGGDMVDASKSNGRVVHRPVFAATGLHYVRLPEH